MKPQVNTKSAPLFIGTSHIDPAGYRHLMEILESNRPDMILLEVSPMSIILRRTYGFICRLILDHNLKGGGPGLSPEIRNIISYLDIPYEYTAARDYCMRTGAVYRLVDVSIISLARFFHAYKLVSKKNLTAAAASSNDRFSHEKGIAGNIFNKNDRFLLNMKLSQFSRDRLAVYRENILLRRVQRIVRKNSGRRIVYIGGWEHLMDAPGTGLLYQGFRETAGRIIAFMNQKDYAK
ncbi:MAG TPA: hypothetical protein PK514_02075 [Spirochaetota bacterium]|nr:hypothetical protein [Spirochaetota bacterium]